MSVWCIYGWGSLPPMAQTIHPCLCGFDCETYAQMKHHRRKCAVWRKRPNPKELTKARRSSHLRKEQRLDPCPHCLQRWDHHAEDCPNSLGKKTRRAILQRHGVPLKLFRLVLKVLAKRYPKPTEPVQETP